MLDLVKKIKNAAYLVFIVLILQACTSDVILLSKLSENDANEVMGALLSQGIPAKKNSEKKDGYNIVIQEKAMSRAVAILKSAGLPNRTKVSLGDVFKKEGVISTPLEERARYIYALSQELEHTISQIDNVVLARVHVVLPERVAPGQPVQPSSAAVFIKHLPELDSDTIEHRVLAMVSRSIPGLSSKKDQKISVSFVETMPSIGAIEWVSVGPFIVQKTSEKQLVKVLVSLVLVSLISVIFAILMLLSKTRLWIVTKITFLQRIAV